VLIEGPRREASELATCADYGSVTHDAGNVTVVRGDLHSVAGFVPV
jgi:hypothetical protein